MKKPTPGTNKPLLALTLYTLAGAAAYSTAARAQSEDALPTVLVTARLRTEPLAQVPASMAVLNGETLAEERLDSLGDLDRRVANLQLGSLNGTPTLFMRGVGGGGRQVGFEPRTGVYVDGVFMNAPPMSDSLLLDLARVEVLRGPQGSLYGQNTDAGNLNLITREPGATRQLETLLRWDDRGEQHLAAAGDLPLREDTLALRSSVNLTRSRGVVRNSYDHERPDAVDEAGARTRLLWRIAPDLRADFSADASLHADDFPTGEARSNISGSGPANPASPYTVSLNSPQRNDLRNRGLGARLQWQLSEMQLEAITARRLSSRRWQVDLDYSTLDGMTLDYIDQYRRDSQELRLRSTQDDGALSWLVGVYTYQQQSDSSRATDAQSQANLLNPNLQDGDRLLVLPRLRQHSEALYGSLGYRFTSQLQLDAGLRWLQLRRALAFDQNATSGFQQLGFANLSDVHERNREHALLPDVALSWQLQPQLRAYLRYAQGSKSGGYNAEALVSPATAPNAFDTETVRSYEVGLKGWQWRQRLSADMAFFLADYSDYQVSQFQLQGSTVLPVMSNAGKLRSYGPELELRAQLAPGLSLQSSAAWLHAWYQDFRDGGGPGVDFSGNRAEYAPRWNLNNSLQYRRPWQWHQLAWLDAALTYSWRSGFYTQPSNLPPFAADSRSLLSARLGVADAAERFRLTAYADNLLDERYTETLNRGTLGTYYGRYGQPRSVGLQLQWRYD
ncbi:TonB-dependent Receptor Plug Domain [Solimonas aquatica]|uniref:TonB-dependent Receptor Plug Domain n=1 Tax=Solimonas aquatica TaxID=489703 RepID=A0A1H9E2I3_9GAMM|nr:TonB-dependent receptor [Solimonas aquatica]SEQ19920.1 TonB-dependent Receptor Plug Domain [Solimonas aquatica]